MAELMLLSEIADPTRFFTDNLLGPEDWGVRSEAAGRGAGRAHRVAEHAGRKRKPKEEGWANMESTSAGGRRKGSPCFRELRERADLAPRGDVELFRGRGRRG